MKVQGTFHIHFDLWLFIFFSLLFHLFCTQFKFNVEDLCHGPNIFDLWLERLSWYVEYWGIQHGWTFCGLIKWLMNWTVFWGYVHLSLFLFQGGSFLPINISSKNIQNQAWKNLISLNLFFYLPESQQKNLLKMPKFFFFVCLLRKQSRT